MWNQLCITGECTRSKVWMDDTYLFLANDDHTRIYSFNGISINTYPASRYIPVVNESGRILSEGEAVYSVNVGDAHD